MLLYHYEKRGLWVLTTLIVGMVVLPRQFSGERNAFFLLEDVVLPDTTLRQTAEQAEALELNTADSLALVRVRGIGPYYARRILNFRERLGGFYSVSQLKELKMTYFNPDSSAIPLKADPTLIRKRELDSLPFKEVLKHPYLEYEEVVLIFQAKRKYGRVTYDTLRKHGVLPAHKLRKIKPYFR